MPSCHAPEPGNPLRIHRPPILTAPWDTGSWEGCEELSGTFPRQERVRVGQESPALLQALLSCALHSSFSHLLLSQGISPHFRDCPLCCLCPTEQLVWSLLLPGSLERLLLGCQLAAPLFALAGKRETNPLSSPCCGNCQALGKAGIW